MGSIYNNIRRFLFGWANREFLIFLFFLAVAGVFWLFMTLNESFEQEIKIPVKYVNVPGNVVITSGENDTLRFTVRDKGASLITYLYSRNLQSIDIDFKRYARSDGRGSVSSSDLLRLVNAMLPTSAKAIGVKPETLSFYYNNGEKKTVPIEIRGTVEPDMLYYIADTVFSSKEVTVYASLEKLDSITKVYTETIHEKGFRDSLVVTAHLQKMDGVKMVPDKITMRFYTDVMTECSIDGIEVIGINMPKGMELRTFPARLSVSFITGMRNYQAIKPTDFLIVADYDEFSSDTTGHCNVYLRKQPNGIQRVALEKDQVEYLIEGHSLMTDNPEE